ncbi:MAG: Calx-beta domain-containing protein [Gemmataceae bacterium]
MRSPRPRKDLAVERLEDRTNPAAHPVAVVGAATYRVGEQLISLDTRADELVIGLPGGAAALAPLVAAGGPLAGTSAARWLTPELVVLTATADRLAQAAAAPGVTFAAPVYQNPDTGGWLVATNEVIVALAPGITPAALANPRVASWEPVSGTPDQFVVRAAAGYGPAAFALTAALAADPRFAWAEPNFYQDWQKYFTPNDPLFGSQWHLNNTAQYSGQTAGVDVDAPPAWDVTQGSQTVVVSVVDDGMEITHPDLAPNVAINQGEIPAAVLAALTDVDGDGIISFLDLNNAVNIGAVGSNKAVDVNANGRIDPDDILAAAASGGWINSADGDGNGYIDDLCGWDFTTNGTTGDLNPGADGANDAHATSVAGVAVGVGNNGLGTTGIAFKSRILPVRVFGTTGAGTTDANFASAIYYAAGRTRSGTGTFRSGDVMNNSWGGGGVSSAITNAFTWATANGRSGKGTPSFISSGNDYAASVSFPSNLAGSNPGVISVGASTDVRTRAAYSNYGPELDVVAPSNGPSFGGVYGIVTTDRQGANGYNTAAGTAGNYTNTLASGFGGTSSASPLAAGIGALVLAVDPNLTAAQVRQLMRATTELIGPNVNASGFAVGYGYGQVNANLAVRGVGVAEVQVLDDRADVPDGTGSVSLGSVGVGGVGVTRTFRVRNQGTLPLTLGAVSVGGPFEVVSGLSATTLTTGQYATFGVRFLPTATGAASGTVTFTTNDANEGTFDFAVTGTGVTPSLAGRPYEDWAGNGAADANDPSLAGRQVYLDMNGNGAYDAALTAVAFNTGTISVAIPDATGAVATSTLAVSGTAGLVSKVTVRVSITHAFSSDLALELVGPNGQSVLLASAVGTGSNFTNTVFDDAGATAIAAGNSPFTGTYRPTEALAQFAGTGANGNWTLRVRDSYAADAGTITSWTLNVTLAEPTQTTAAAGTYAFAGLAAGTYAVRTVVPGGWTATGPAGNSYSQTLAAGGSVTGLDFGSVRQNAVYGQMVNDLNGNGARDGGEPVLTGWRVFDDRNGNGTQDGGEANALTDALGNYVLPGLSTGATTVRVERQAGYRTTLGVAGLPLTVVAGSTYHGRDFAAVADNSPPSADVIDVTPDPRTTAVPAVTVVFTEAVTGFDLADLSLTRDGGANLLTASQTLTTGDNVTWTLGNLAGLTAASGTYTLTLTAAGSGIQDAAQNTLAAAASDTWLTATTPTVSVSDVTAGEGGGPAVFTVTLSGPSPDTILVPYATADGTAAAGADYTAASGTLTFAPGETSKTVSVALLNDTRDEPDETFVLNLGTPTNAIITVGQGVATITDDDPTPSLSISGVTQAEGDSGATAFVFTVTLSAASGRVVSVNYATADGTATAGGDYSAASGTLTFAPGETTKSVSVLVTGDVRDEADETFTLALSGAANATVATTSGLGTIVDDDPTPTLSVGSVSLAEGTGGTTAFAFTVTLSAASGRAVTVNYATADGTATGADYAATSGALTFAAGETAKTVTVLVTGDALDEDDEMFTFGLSGATNATLATASGLGTIMDDDAAPGVSINSASAVEGNSGATPLVFTVTLSAASGRAVTVNYATADGTATGADYVATSGALTFAPGETAKTVTVLVTGDALDEDDETFSLGLSAASNATVAAAAGTGAIRDDDLPPVLSVNSVSLTEGDGGTAPMVFTVSLSAPSGKPVTVNYATAGGTATAADFAATSGTLTFAPGETSKTVTVLVTGDVLDEADETFTVGLSGSTNAAVGTATGTGTILDDDPTPALSVNNVSLAEGTGGTTAFVFTVTLSAASGRSVTVNYATADGTATAADYAAASGTLTFAPGETAKTVTVLVTGDALDEDDETFTLGLSGATNATIATAAGTGTIPDDDAPPSLAVGAVTLAEGTGGATAFAFTVTLSAASGRSVSVGYATAGGTATAGMDFTAASGTLTFAPGETTKTVTVLVTGDVLDEDDETFTFGLGGATNATIATATAAGTILDDDLPPVLSVNAASVAEGNSGSTALVFTVTLSAPSGRPVGVGYATADGTAAAADYTAASGALTFAPGETTRTVSVLVTGDALDEADETFTLGLGGATNATIATATATGTILDDDPLPGLSIDSVTRAEGNSGATPFTFTVTLSAASGRTVAVNFVTTNGTATTADGDYSFAGGTLTFAPGETTKTVTVQAAGDARNEADETFRVLLSGATNGTVTTPTGTGTITNDDPLPVLSVNAVSRAEGTGGTTTVTVTVTLSAVSGQTVTVDYATADGTATVADGDYAAASGTLTFAPGVTTRTFALAVSPDARNEADETIGVTLAAPTNATLGTPAATVTVVDDDPVPALSVSSVSLAEGTGGPTAVAFTVTLSAVSGRTVTVSYATADGTATVADGDYSFAGGTLTFAPGETTKTVTVQAAGDARNEDDETFTIGLGGATNATVAAGTGTATLLDDDPLPALSVDSVSLAEGTGGGTAFTFTVSLSAVSGRTVSVGFATADGTAAVADGDYTATSGTLTFAPGVTTRTFTVAVTGDPRNETDETFAVNLSAATNATISAPSGTGTVVNDDPLPTLSVGPASAAEGGALVFAVSLSAVSGRTVTVNYATADGTATAADYSAASGTLTFAPGETTKTVTVATAADATFEPDETLALNLGGESNAVIAAGTGTGTGTILNDDAEPTAVLSGGGSVGESGGSATVAVSLSNPSYLPVTVTFALGGTATTADFVAPPASVTIPAGQLTAAVTITASADTADEPDETVTLAIGGVANGGAAGGLVVVTITDDDVPVAAAAGFDLTEDVVFTTPTSLLAAANAQPGSVVELVGAAPGGGVLTLNASGTFTFAPAPNAHGTVGFNYLVRNPAGEVSAPAAVELRVAAVNDAPTFAPGPSQTDPRRAGPQVAPGWASAVSAGPPDEAGQRLTFEVTTDNPTLFVVQPAIDPATGTLTYTPGSGFGTAVVSVRLHDDAGGTSAARTFTIHVLRYRDDDLPTNQDEVGLIGVGSGDGGTVAAFRGDGKAAGTMSPFAGASARVVTADVTGDGVADVIAATGPGVRSRVVVLDGATGAVVRTILPFEDSFTGGLFVAAADIDGDGKAEIAVSPDTGGGGRVTVYGETGTAADFFGIDDAAFRGGARVTFGDVDGDGLPDLVVAAGFGGGPRVAVYDGATLTGTPARLVNDFFAFPGTDAVNLRNGVFVAAGDVDGDGFADLAFGGGPGGAPRVLVLSGRLVSAGRVDESQAAPVGNFFVAGNAADRGGVRVAVKDADGDDQLDVVVGSGERSAARVRVYAGTGFGGGGEPGEFLDLEPFGGAVLAGGVYVG